MSDAQKQAAAQCASIVEMVKALQCDYERLQELRELASSSFRYIAGWNMPGYMPDSEPAEFDDADDARGYLAGEIDIEAENLMDQADGEERNETSALQHALRDDAAALRDSAETLRALTASGPAAEFGATLGRYHYWITVQPGLTGDDAAELAELEAAAGDCEDEDKARQRIDEDPLCVEVRSDWRAPGSDDGPAEFCILLCTGGPAVRIVGQLDRGQPSRPRVEYQDWGTPWTEYFPDADTREALQAYVECFYFGDE